MTLSPERIKRIEWLRSDAFAREWDEVCRQLQHYQDVDCWTLLEAMQRIDRARYQLVKAQNDLAGMLRSMSETSQEEFGYFYQCGGCTAQDWQDWINEEFRQKPTTRREQLRLVSSSAPKHP